MQYRHALVLIAATTTSQGKVPRIAPLQAEDCRPSDFGLKTESSSQAIGCSHLLYTFIVVPILEQFPQSYQPGSSPLSQRKSVEPLFLIALLHMGSLTLAGQRGV